MQSQPFYPNYPTPQPSPQTPYTTTPPSAHYVYQPPTYPSYAPPQPTLAYPSYTLQPSHLLPPSPHLRLPTSYQSPLRPPSYLYATSPSPAQQPQTQESTERDTFYRKLHSFRDSIGEPIQRLPTLGFKELDLWVLYKEVIARRGIDAVIAKKQWKEVAEALQLPSSCTDSGFRLRLHYKKYLKAFERKFYHPPPVPAPTSPAGSTPTRHVTKHPRPTPTKPSPQNPPLQRASSSVTSVGSGVTVVNDTENESAATVSNGSGNSRRSSAGTADEATSKGEAKLRRTIVKKKKRAVSLVVADKSDEVELGAHPKLTMLHVAAQAASKRAGKLDFSVLECATLKRYAKVHGVGGESAGKVELAERVSKHFEEMPLRDGETATLLRFIEAVRRR